MLQRLAILIFFTFNFFFIKIELNKMISSSNERRTVTWQLFLGKGYFISCLEDESFTSTR